jgi:hypothetical protein
MGNIKNNGIFQKKLWNLKNNGVFFKEIMEFEK